MFEIRQVRMPDGEVLYLLADKTTGLPDSYVIRHTYVNLRPSGASSETIRAKLRGIRVGLTLLREHDVDIERRISVGRYLDDEELHSLANRCIRRLDGTGRIGGDVAADRYSSFIDYFCFRTGEVLQYSPVSEHAMINTALASFRERAKRRRPRSSDGAERNERLGLELHQRELLLEVIRPGDPGNPFQPALQVRNHAIVIIAYELGFRAGEIFSLKRQDFNDRSDPATITVHRRPDDPDETRKEPALVKTYGRTLPLEGQARRAIDAWLKERGDRARFPNARRNPYIFTSRSGDPMTLRRGRQLFELLRDRHPELGRFVHHVLRHDANDRWTEHDEEHHVDAERSRKERTYAFGWSDTSTMPELYGKAATRRATQKRMETIQRKAMEENGE